METSKMEKRIDKRAELEETAKFKVLGNSEESMSYKYEKASTRNISKGGVCMTLPYKITAGDVIRVEIPMKSDVIKAFCEVQWCINTNDSNYEAGLSFIALKEDDVDLLDKYVSELPDTHAV